MLPARVCGLGRRACWWGLAAGVVLLVAAPVLQWAAFPAILRMKIVQAVQLQDGSEAMARFVELPQPLLYKVFLFNVTNPDEVSTGARPRLQQLGPYVYQEWYHRHDLARHDDGSLSYRLNTTFRFSPERSGNVSEDDIITFLNVIMMGTVVQISGDLPSLLTLVEPVLEELLVGGLRLFRTARVRELLFEGVPVLDCRGNYSALASYACNNAHTFVPPTVREAQRGLFVFSFFGFKNGTSRQWWRVDSGLSDVSSLGSVLAYDNSSRLRVWEPGNSPCNDIRGTDSTIFPPFRTPNDSIYIFSNDICRSMNAEFEREEEVSGVPGLRYVASKNLLRSGGRNACTCPKGGCLASGALDIRQCLRAPIAISFPHFYQASPEYLQYAEGLSPNKEEHETFVVIEPESGTPLVGSKRLQFNMLALRVPQVSAMRDFPEGLFPLLWIDEGVVLEEKEVSKVRAVYTARASVGGVAWAVLAVGALALGICAVSLLRSRQAQQQAQMDTRGGKLSVPTLGAAYPETATSKASSVPPMDATHF